MNINNIKRRDDFVNFLREFKSHINSKEWENDNLKSFLEGFLGYCHDMQDEDISWQILANILKAATVYE